jgi:hypothetical protein
VFGCVPALTGAGTLSRIAGYRRITRRKRSGSRVGLTAPAVALTCLALGVLAPSGAAIVPPSDCGILVVKGHRYDIKADQLRCVTARSHASRYLKQRQRPGGYTCRDYGRETKLKFRCSRGIKVFFAIRR